MFYMYKAKNMNGRRNIFTTVLLCPVDIYIALLWHGLYSSLLYKNALCSPHANALVAVAIRVQCDYSRPTPKWRQ